VPHKVASQATLTVSQLPATQNQLKAKGIQFQTAEPTLDAGRDRQWLQNAARRDQGRPQLAQLGGDLSNGGLGRCGRAGAEGDGEGGDVGALLEAELEGRGVLA
jgi:hypothetical protein